MSVIIPPARPQCSVETARGWLTEAGCDGPAVLLRRGYYRDSMSHGANAVGIYDDACAVVGPTTFRTFNANTDPSRVLPGIAVLQPGVYAYTWGIHNISKDPAVHPHYKALVQRGPVRITRYGSHGVEVGDFAIHVHHGGETGTSSLGCQTIPPGQWDEFVALVEREFGAELYQARIPVVLTVRP